MVKIAAMGDNVVDCYLARGEMYPGGNCLNVSVYVSRFGGRSAYVGAIAKDRAGDLIQAALTSERVDVTRLRRLEGSTAYCLIGHRNADRVFLDFDLGVSMFAPTQEDLDFLSGFQAVHIGQSSGLDPWVAAMSDKTLLSYDFSTRRDPEHRREIAPYCYLASVSGDGLDDKELGAIASELLACGSKWVLVTRGRSGAVLHRGLVSYRTPARLVEPVDTLGAGDTFIARTLFGLLKQEAPRDILRHAAEAAAATCQYYGAIGHATAIDIGKTTPEVLRRARYVQDGKTV
ncbi:PfkB family carbohydrate kinase [Mesorhizobium sp.]|uniref:PfkB family carbohydrate kinase n=1 Tax=Mesorhizobium sp. TaxID=1871066 RepID=UPI000FE5D777|nr:PfkB family carbohydrate kinase [Mesorhizobium sp.]RWC26667.1 MAG: ribokinase [Mesorhizobium sp.]TIX21457.1 MAG: ribokinase [Mesorhizobium sp.]